MSSFDPFPRADLRLYERAYRAWARAGGIVFAVLSLVAMAHAAEWDIRGMLLDPLVWMVALVATAAGLVCGFALSVRLYGRAGD